MQARRANDTDDNVQVHRSVGEAPEGADKELTKENVDRVLNQIRGYLFADGGDIDVVDVHDGNVFVRFQVCSKASSIVDSDVPACRYIVVLHFAMLAMEHD